MAVRFGHRQQGHLAFQLARREAGVAQTLVAASYVDKGDDGRLMF